MFFSLLMDQPLYFVRYSQRVLSASVSHTLAVALCKWVEIICTDSLYELAFWL